MVSGLCGSELCGSGLCGFRVVWVQGCVVQGCVGSGLCGFRVSGLCGCVVAVCMQGEGMGTLPPPPIPMALKSMKPFEFVTEFKGGGGRAVWCRMTPASLAATAFYSQTSNNYIYFIDGAAKSWPLAKSHT